MHGKSPKIDCNCQKQKTFSPKQYKKEGSGFRKKMKKTVKLQKKGD